jgi:two-component system sensor histidine kinase UhpB
VHERSDLLRARLAAIVDSSDDAIVSKTLDGIIMSWNRGAEQLFGYTAAEAIGQHIFLIIPDDRREEEEDVLARLRRGEKVDHFETVRRTKDGRQITISLTVSPVRDATGRIVGASKVARDITDRILVQEMRRRAHEDLEERVRERTAELVEANEALRREMERRREVEHDRQRLFTRLVLAQEEERRRIARELHDQLGQQITALRITLETLGAIATSQPELRDQIEALQDLAKQLDQDVAFRVWELRPAALEVLGLGAALTEYAGNWAKRFGIHAELHVARPTGTRLTPETETTMYRFAQEALNNVAKHSRADRVDIVLDYVNDHASLIVEDNGIGFDPSQLQTPGQGFGLMGMRERAALAGGEFRIESARGHGTTLILRVPAMMPLIGTS